MRNLPGSLFALYFLGLTPALAAGYGLREFSADAMGSAYAGASATASDASYQAYNPAAIAGVVQSDFSITAIDILPTSSASYSTARTSAGTPVSGATNPAGFISNAILPEIALRTRLGNQWSAGIVVYAPWGLSTDYPLNSAGRYYALATKLTTVNITPSIAYEISPGFAIAAGAQAEYAKGKLSSAIDIGTLGASLAVPGSIPGAFDGTAKLSASSWGAGFVVGLLAHPADNVTAGLSYHSIVQHHLSGVIDYTLDSAGLGNAIKSATGLFTELARVGWLDDARLGQFWAEIRYYISIDRSFRTRLDELGTLSPATSCFCQPYATGGHNSSQLAVELVRLDRCGISTGELVVDTRGHRV